MDRTLKENLEKRLKEHHVVKKLMDVFKCDGSSYYYAELVGGAIIDILENRTPKDFDLILTISYKREDLEKMGFVFQYNSKTANTYKLLDEESKDIIVQTLNTRLDEFDFTISQTCFDLKKGTLKIDEQAFNRKQLIPVDFSPKRALNSLRRLIHWQKKGYNIDELTYQSLVNSAFKTDRNEDGQGTTS